MRQDPIPDGLIHDLIVPLLPIVFLPLALCVVIYLTSRYGARRDRPNPMVFGGFQCGACKRTIGAGFVVIQYRDGSFRCCDCDIRERHSTCAKCLRVTRPDEEMTTMRGSRHRLCMSCSLTLSRDDADKILRQP